jgi:hypothetical protein
LAQVCRPNPIGFNQIGDHALRPTVGALDLQARSADKPQDTIVLAPAVVLPPSKSFLALMPGAAFRATTAAEASPTVDHEDSASGLAGRALQSQVFATTASFPAQLDLANERGASLGHQDANRDRPPRSDGSPEACRHVGNAQDPQPRGLDLALVAVVSKEFVLGS